MTSASETPRGRIRELVLYFLRLGLLGFGGPVALVGQMERELVGRARLADQGADARGDRHLPISAGTARDPGRDLHLLSARRLLGRVGGRLGLHPAELRDRGGLGRALCPSWRPEAGDGDILWREPAVIALILHSCWRLAKLGMEDWLQWAIAAVCFVVTVILQAEVALLFIGAGWSGFCTTGTRSGSAVRRRLRVAAPLAATAPLAPAASGSTLGKLLLFFLKAGSLTFGSGLVIVPFLEQGLVQEYGWLDQRQFLIAVAIGMISPGPVVITATFVGYLVAGFWGSLVSTVGIFLPSFILVLIAAPSRRGIARTRTSRAS